MAFLQASTFTAYRPSEHGQIIQIPLWFEKLTMPLFRYLHKKNILGDGTMSRVPRKRDNQQIGDRVRSCSVRILSADETSFAVVCAAFRCLFYRLGSRCLILLSKFKVPRVNLTSHRTILWNKFVKNTDSNKTSHFRVVFKVKHFLKADFGVEQLIYRCRTVMKSNFAILKLTHNSTWFYWFWMFIKQYAGIHLYIKIGNLVQSPPNLCETCPASHRVVGIGVSPACYCMT